MHSVNTQRLSYEHGVKEFVFVFSLLALVVTGLLAVVDTVAPTAISLPFVNTSGTDPLLLALAALAVVVASLRISR